MKLQDFGLLTDENIHPDVVAFLRIEGYDVLDVKESSLIGSSDITLIRRAFAENRVVVTHDSDFGTLAIAKLEPIIGIIYLRPGHIDPQFTITTLQVLMHRDLDIHPPFMIVGVRTGSVVKIRIREY